MSVINNVLKGLESRESQFTPIDISPIEQKSTPVRNYRLLLYPAVLLVLLACAAAVLLLQRADFASVMAMLTPAGEVTPVAAAETRLQPAPTVTTTVALPQQPPVNQIRGLQIRETETEMRLEFELGGRVAAYLKERSENSFEYHLRSIESRIEAPLMRDNPWIQSLGIVQVDSGVDIDFVTAPDILVETRQYQSDGESIWVINLRQSRPSMAAAPVEPAKSAAPAEPVRPAVAAIVTAPAAEPAALQGKSSVTDEAAPEVAAVKLEIRSTNVNSKPGEQLQYAVELINAGRAQDAETLLLGLLDGPGDYQARQHLLALYQRQQTPGRLRSLLLASLKAYPQDPVFVTQYARALFASGAYRQVTQLLAQDAVLDVSQRALLAASYQRLDQHDQAIDHYRLALQMDAADARNWVGLGISQEQNAAFVDALDSYQRAVRLGSLNERLQAFAERRSNKLRQVVN